MFKIIGKDIHITRGDSCTIRLSSKSGYTFQEGDVVRINIFRKKGCSDIEKSKKELYKIINSNETLKKIPNKMKNQLNNVVGEYRIYYNNLEPIIYTSIVENHVKLTIRFLCHPKKVRNIESDIWNKILIANKNGKIKLFID